MAVLVLGSSGGVGSAIAERFVKEGETVAGLDIQGPFDGAPWQHRTADLQNFDQVSQVLESLETDIDVVVHAAAVQPLIAVGGGDMAEWSRAFAVNVLSLEHVVSCLLPSLVRKRGTVVAISSVHASTTSPRMAPYSCSKAALEGWIRAAAIDLAPDVAALAISLGAVDTPKLHEGLARWDDPDAARQRLESRIPMRRVMTADEVASSVFALTQPAFRHLSGTSVHLDGGVSARLASE